MMNVETVCHHLNHPDCADPDYWIDWAVDDLAYNVLRDVRWPAENSRRHLKAIADHFRRNLQSSDGLTQFVESCMDPIEIERALTVCAEAFVQTHYPDIELRYEPLQRKLKLQELAPREEAADILHSVAGMIEPKSPEAAACLVRHAESEQGSADEERLRIQSCKNLPIDDVIAVVESLITSRSQPAVRCDIASNLVESLLNESNPQDGRADRARQGTGTRGDVLALDAAEDSIRKATAPNLSFEY